MRNLKLLFGFLLITTLSTSCVVDEVIIVDNNPQSITLNQVLNSYDLWYVDVNVIQGFGEVPFMQMTI